MPKPKKATISKSVEELVKVMQESQNLFGEKIAEEVKIQHISEDPDCVFNESKDISGDVEVTDNLIKSTHTGQVTPIFIPQFSIKSEKQKNIPPNGSRNAFGLLDNLNYEFDESGFVNYKKLIPQEYLVPNKQYFERFKKPLPTTTEGLSDKEVLVLLQGWKALSGFRQYKSVNHDVISASRESVTVKTTIVWKGNYETSYEDVSFSALATASLDNTFSFAKNYLAEIAENRGLCRAIRGFLRIPIVGFDEVGPSSANETSNDQESNNNTLSPIHACYPLQRKLDDYGISWEIFQASCVNKGVEGADSWTDIAQIPPNIVRGLIGKLIEKHEEKLAKMAADKK